MIPCAIVGVTQRIDFETNLSQSFAILRLADGQVFEAAISPESATLLVEVQVGGAGMPGQEVRVPPPPGRLPTSVPAAKDMQPVIIQDKPDEEVHIFGGDGQAASAELPHEEYASPPAHPQPAPQFDPRAQKAHKRGEFISDAPRRTMPMDSHGYPMTTFNGVDPAAFTGGDKDEDGVGSF